MTPNCERRRNGKRLETHRRGDGNRFDFSQNKDFLTGDAERVHNFISSWSIPYRMMAKELQLRVLRYRAGEVSFE